MCSIQLFMYKNPSDKSIYHWDFFCFLSF
ncbi:tetracycline resistance protein [Lactococcus formosensis]